MEALRTHCAQIASGKDAMYDKTIIVDVGEITRQVSWGITPAHAIPVDAVVPFVPEEAADKDRTSYEEAYAYMDLHPGQSIMGLPIQRVFIGSCSNGRLSNISEVAKLVDGQHIAEGVEAWVVPGSQQVKKEAEDKGYDQIIKEAGFMWGEPCCSLCGGCNGERIPAGQRCVSTTNRNFIGRQGPGARTHLASPYTAVKAALTGKIG